MSEEERWIADPRDLTFDEFVDAEAVRKRQDVMQRSLADLALKQLRAAGTPTKSSLLGGTEE